MERREDDPDIMCPFLHMAPPDTRNSWVFARAASANGLSLPLSMLVTAVVVARQKGLWALVRGEAPDLHALHQVPGISHEDLYVRYLPQLREQADASAVDGRIRFQQLVEMKEWVAAQEAVEISAASKVETSLAFLRAGGDLQTWTVNVDDLFLLLGGEQPVGRGDVTASNLASAQAEARWS